MSEERRIVTILFADVVGSTALGEELDPEDVRALLGRLFAIASDAVEQHGGRVEKFIGDAIMAVFGLPIAHDDDPARALSAALELRDRARADPLIGTRLPIRLGVNGGEVIASRDAAAQQFLITGDPVNTAARLEQAAEPWMILVGERTIRAVGTRFAFGPPLAVEAKGKSVPVTARPLEGAAAIGAIRVRRQRLFGRAADLEQLELTARRAFDERRPFLVSMVAPAGVGKSRLLEEFLDRLGPEVHIALAQCLPYGQRLTYWPMRAILLAILGAADDSTPDDVRSALVTWLRAAHDPEPDRTAELLAATIGASGADTGDRIALFAAWRRVVELAADRSPLVLVIEDLHWSSDSLLDLIEAILQPRAEVPLVMVALARPELLDRRPSWGGGRRNAISISLEPLAQTEVASLVADLLEAPAAEIVDAVVARAEGNPFYAGEIVRALTDRLGAIPDPRAVGDAVAALPDTVQATVLARLDALDVIARRIVQLGAVLGRTFSRHALPALDATLDETAVTNGIDALIDRDLVRPAARDQFTFRHILIREVAYGTLPRGERARLHAAAGGWLETEAQTSGREDELAELVAFHLREATALAGLLGEPAAPDLAARAVRWLRRAGDVANAGAATVEAARHLEAALALAPVEGQAELYERLGEVWVGGEQALEAFEHAYELGRRLNLGSDQQLRALSQILIVRFRYAGSVADRSSHVAIRDRLDEVRGLLKTSPSARARMLGTLAVAFSASGPDIASPEQIAVAKQASIEAIDLAAELDDPDALSGAYDARATIALADNLVVEALGVETLRLALADRLNTYERMDAQIMIAWLNALLGNLAASEEASRAARTGLSTGQAPSWVAGALGWQVMALHWLGQWDEALAEAERMERTWRDSEIKAPWYLLNGILAAFAICRSRGDPVGLDRWRESATRIFERSDPGIRTQRMVSFVNDSLEELEQTAVDEFRVFSGRLDYPAISLARLADRRYPAQSAPLDKLISYAEERSLRLVASQARRFRGIVNRSEADLTAALDTFEAMGARPYVARCKTELGLLAGRPELIEAGLIELEALGDVEQAARVAIEQRARSFVAAR